MGVTIADYFFDPRGGQETGRCSCIIRSRESGVLRGRYFQEGSRSPGRIVIRHGVIFDTILVFLQNLRHGLIVFGTFCAGTVWGLGFHVTRNIIVGTTELFVPTVSTTFPAGGVDTVIIPSS